MKPENPNGFITKLYTGNTKESEEQIQKGIKPSNTIAYPGGGPNMKFWCMTCGKEQEGIDTCKCNDEGEENETMEELKL